MTQRANGSRLLARERFLGGAGDDASVRPEIRASWRRSQLHGVAPDRLPELPVDELDRDSRLLRAGRPVLDRMTDDIADFSMSLVLTDARARILDRRVGVGGLRAQLDGINAVPGAAYTEETVGTNGVGSCIETGGPFMVAGGEHFAAPLCQLTCAAVPILHPFTGRLEGVLDVTCGADDTTALMLAFVRQAAVEIGRRLEELASAAERALFDTFLAASRRSHRPVLSVSDELVIANAAAARLLEPADHLAVWEQVGRILDGPSSGDLALASGRYHAEVVPIAVGDRSVGALVRLGEDAELGARRRTFNGTLPGLVGTSSAWRTVCRDATAVARSGLATLVHGEDGSGKLAVAKAIHALGGGGPVAVVDAADATTWPAWLDALRRRAAEPGTIVVRHLELLAPEHAAVLAATGETPTARLVATADERWLAQASRRLVDRFPGRVAVPPLRERSGDMSALVDELVRRHAEVPGAVRVRREVPHLLAAQPWPGNVRELESMLRGVLARRRRGDIGVGDLPPEYRSPPTGALTSMQLLERDAIARALDAEHGNKQAAAGRLGISRSTLYRKLDIYGVT